MIRKILIVLTVLVFTNSCSLFTPNKEEWISKDIYPIIPEGNAELLEVKKIWEHAPHNAFTDLVRYKGYFYITFREAKSHHSFDGSIRVIKSKKGVKWQSEKIIKDNIYDLRDPKLSISTDNNLYIFTTGRIEINYSNKSIRSPFLLKYDENNDKWSRKISVYNISPYWLWNMRWLNNTAFSIGSYGSPTKKRWISIFRKNINETSFKKVANKVYENNSGYNGSPSEADILFLNNNHVISLLRRNGNKDNTSLIGYSKSPFIEWSWKKTKKRIGGPKLLQLPDGRIIAGVRLYKNNNTNGKRRTSLCWLDPLQARLHEFLTLPSGSDTGYTGLTWYNNYLWVSYYSTHEGGVTSIYLAKVKIE